jgi:hypothetical protein
MNNEDLDIYDNIFINCERKYLKIEDYKSYFKKIEYYDDIVSSKLNEYDFINKTQYFISNNIENDEEEENHFDNLFNKIEDPVNIIPIEKELLKISFESHIQLNSQLNIKFYDILNKEKEEKSLNSDKNKTRNLQFNLSDKISQSKMCEVLEYISIFLLK